MPPLPPPQAPKSKRGLMIGVGLVGVLVVALVLAMAFGGDDSTDSVSTGTAQGPASTVKGGTTPNENQPVTVTGDHLPVLPDPGTTDNALGQLAPTLDGYDFDGAPIQIKPGGKPKMVVFLAHWCPHCNREIPRLIEWKASGAIPADLEIYGVTTSVKPSAPNYPPSKWIVDKAWPWPVMADSDRDEAAAAYGLTGFPYFVVLGADGTVKVRFSGEIEVAQLTDVVKNALNS